ncbi:MAG: D-alanyl-D-alanine carboxypeptidase/D-alanyl-D-alanine-endopeptidase [Bacteroidales bacterium]
MRLFIYRNLKFPLTLLLLLFLLLPYQLLSQNNIAKYIKELQKEPNFTSSAISILVMDSKGRSVASWNPDMRLNTASTMKTVTTGVALALLGPNFQFSTKIKYSGTVIDSILQGDLYIVGGADPTLGSKESIATPIEIIFKEWKEAIERAGIKRVEGHIVADNRFFSTPSTPRSWSWSQLGTSYGAGADALSFVENRQQIRLIPGTNEGDSVKIEQFYPYIPGMEYQNQLNSGRANSSLNYFYYLSPLTKTAQIRGRVPLHPSHRTITVANKFPHLSCAYHFMEFLNANGILVESQILDANHFNGPKEEELTPIAETLSPPLHQIVEVTNRNSNNFFAETLFRAIGKIVKNDDSYGSSKAAVKRELTKMGLTFEGYKQEDGSGLSRLNLASSRFFCNYFRAIEKSEIFEIFFHSLPVAGEQGTLKKVLAQYPMSVRSRVHAKSGTLSNCRCYAGFVERKKGGLLYFAIITNNLPISVSKAQPSIERFLYELTKY